MTFVVRSALPPATLLPVIREALRGLDASLPLAYPRTLDDIVATGSARARITAWLLITAAASALLLGVVGIYGVIAYAGAVARRSWHCLALGASPLSVTWMVLRQGAVIGATGIAAGILTALGLTHLLAGLLFEVGPRDGATFVLVSATMLLVALAATALPARRAARTDPARDLTTP